MRIVLTGGWGYGNLGDDAILDSTIKMIKEVYPGCIIDVLTYDLCDSLLYDDNSSISVNRSVHSYVDFNASEISFKHLNKDYPFLRKVFMKIKRYAVDSSVWCNISSFERYSNSVKETIRGADLLVVSGGGYFNEKWIGSVMAHLVEMKIAIELKVPFCVAGPTIGIFSNQKIKKLVMDTFRESKSIYVRDVFSLKQFKEEGIDVKLIPDIVLSEWKEGSNTPSLKEDVIIGLILTNQNKDFRSEILIALKIFLSKFPHIGRVKILLSRRWKQDFLTNLSIQKELETLGLNTEIVVPGSFYSLEANLSKCSVVISENLHGLILSTRNGVPIVAINDYPEGSPNYTKIVSFVTQIESESFVINRQKNSEEILDMISKAYNSNEKFKITAKELCKSTEKKSKEFFLI